VLSERGGAREDGSWAQPEVLVRAAAPVSSEAWPQWRVVEDVPLQPNRRRPLSK
jgi:hypothetical protein